MSKEKANYWPHAIVLAIFGVAGLCVWTVNIAVNNPVELDSFYFDSYQNVEQNYNDIINSQEAFDAKYDVILPAKDLKIGKNTIMIKVMDKEHNSGIDEANVTVVITRPDTQRLDKKPKVISTLNGVYALEPFEIKRLGRWQIMSKVRVGDLTTFKKLEVNATK